MTATARRRRWGAALAALIALAAAMTGVPAFAACYPMAGLEPRLIPANFAPGVAVKPHHLRIEFLGHSSFRLTTAEGVRAITDYNGFIRGDTPPDIVTMNNAHESHYTEFIDEGIKYVLRGWDPEGGVARHNLKLRDLRVRNVPTNLRDFGGRLSNGNSIFLFETAGLCVAHISHLHHVLSADQLRDLGRIDVAFVAIDGMWTMSHDELFDLLARLKPSLAIPMHFGSSGGVAAFIGRAQAIYKVREQGASAVELSYRDLPRKTEVLFLEPQQGF